ncbi:hypothetical protein DXG03_004191 [Asterophora parasitica]|uniref:Polysaccharide lyase family 8 protein n=1 Tax=Asterophora parasitica TaxID=117018 RepID=A0A9P7G7A5_9AGAR|nr:hypothetical protein DXG03_004191 [Asterophora parasitica]
MKNFNFLSLILLGLTSTLLTSTLATHVADPLPGVDIPILRYLLPQTSASTTTTKLASTTTSAAPTSTPSSVFQQDFETILARRLPLIVSSLLSNSIKGIPGWLTSLGPNGQWPQSQVDYTTGCAARRANWPAQTHWQRIILLAAAWHGGLPGAEKYVKDPAVRASISSAMGYWFSRDITNLACVDTGGTPACPCTNADNTLCYSYFGKYINGLGYLTGANTLDVASVGIDYSLLTGNETVITDAYHRIHDELAIMNVALEDGIRADGSFGQHDGVLYNGNYGKDFVNDILALEIEAAGTQFAANETGKAAFATLIAGDRWMIYSNVAQNVLHWDFAVLGRFISFPVIDKQATASINVNLSQVQQLGQLWNSNPLISFATSLSAAAPNANAGGLTGQKVFFNNDYVVHRGSNYVATLKMVSPRTQNSECVNGQNPFGFHLADGAFRNYIRGDEYEDIAASWDWNLIPGITVDYGATPLQCATANFSTTEPFVGGVSTGSVGIAAMRFANPLTKNFSFQKAWFFLADDVQHVMISNISSKTNATVYSVLDQRRQSGGFVFKNATLRYSKVQTLYHGNVGYVVPVTKATTLLAETASKTGNWSNIGTSTQPPTTVNLFTARLQHLSINTPVSYTAFPGVDQATFTRKANALRLESVRNDASVSALFDYAHNTALVVFWDVNGGSSTFDPSAWCSFTITASGNAAIIYNVNTGEVTVSDPSQTLSSVKVTIKLALGKKLPALPFWDKLTSRTLTFTLPQGGLGGSSVTQKIK